MKTNKQGGKRPGAGRKPADNPKQVVFIYVPTAEVLALGGKPAVKKLAEAAVARAAKKLI